MKSIPLRTVTLKTPGDVFCALSTPSSLFHQTVTQSLERIFFSYHRICKTVL